MNQQQLNFSNFLQGKLSDKVITRDKIQFLENVLKNASLISVDVEGDENLLYGIGFSVKEGGKILSYYIPTAYSSVNVPIEKVKLLFNQIKDKHFVAHNIKYDYKVLKKFGIVLPKFNLHDTLILAWILDPEIEKKGLDTLASKYIGKNKLKNFKDVRVWDVNELSEYCVVDTEITILLFEKLLNDLSEEKQLKGIYELERKLITFIADMESRGVCVDLDRLKNVSETIEKKMIKLFSEISAITGKNINPNSSEQVRSVLPREILEKLPKKKSGVSTDKRHLEQFSSDPLISRILEYRHLSTVYDTFVKKFLELPRIDNYVIIKSDFRQDGTKTGRLRSVNPNLQNIPAKDELGNLIRSCFVPREGNLFIIADANQLELRILAAITKDKNLMDIYLQNKSLHEDVSKRLGVDYFTAKTINFSIVYGVSPQSLSKRLKISEKEAKRLIDEYYQTFPGILKHKENVKQMLIGHKMSKSIFGRRRFFRDVNLKDFKDPKTQSAFREAFNYTIQASGADLIKIWMYELSKRNIEGAILQVHDEIVFEVDREVANGLAGEIKDCYENNKYITKLGVPFVMDVVVAKSWGEKS